MVQTYLSSWRGEIIWGKNSNAIIDFWFMNFILGLRVHLVTHAGELSMLGGVKERIWRIANLFRVRVPGKCYHVHYQHRSSWDLTWYFLAWMIEVSVLQDFVLSEIDDQVWKTLTFNALIFVVSSHYRVHASLLKLVKWVHMASKLEELRPFFMSLKFTFNSHFFIHFIITEFGI
jgi:hypothetical protein